MSIRLAAQLHIHLTQSTLDLWTWNPFPQGNPEPTCWPRMHWKVVLLQGWGVGGGLQPQPLNPDMWGRKAWHPQLKLSSLTLFSTSSSSSCEASFAECHFSALGAWWWAPSRTRCGSPHRTDSACPERGLSTGLHWGSGIQKKEGEMFRLGTLATDTGAVQTCSH